MFYYKYIDPILDYLQPLPKILSDSVVLGTVGLFIVATVVTLALAVRAKS